MKPSRLPEFGFTLAGLLAGVAIGIWTSLAFFTTPTPDQGRLAQRIAAVFVIAGIILMQVIRLKTRSQNKDE
jgi:hypothetical protein